MALKGEIKEMKFGVGDKVRVVQRIKDGDKSREAYFEGMVIKIKGRNPGKTFTVRKIAEGGIGVERIFPFDLPSIDKIQVIKEGTRGVRRAKLYYTRSKSPTDIEAIHKRASIRQAFKDAKGKSPKKSSPKKKAAKK
jgi:large subunit ribosomal protein L19